MQIQGAAVSPAVQGIQDSASSAATEPLTGRIATGFADVLHGIDRSEAYVDRVIRLASAGRDFSPAELIAIQAGVYRYAQELEALSKLVDATTGCVRRTLEAAG